ncbi:MAG: hypothetical protein KDD84_16910, partial [Caldilineaceae bacterium]|nr:hypothetical protein [Caldilineaceae bacterium]
MQTSTNPSSRFGWIPPWLRRLFNADGWAYGLFWSWNAVFLAFMILGFAPQLLPVLLAAVQAGEIPFVFLGYGIALTLTPVLAVVIGFVWLRKSPRRLFALGYGVEGPVMLLLLVRFFGIREATLPVNLILAIAALGLVTYLWRVLDPRIETRNIGWSFAYAVGATLLLLIGIYACTWLLFYVIPAPVFMARIFGDIWREADRFVLELWRALREVDWTMFLRLQWQWVPFWLLGMVLFLFTGALVLAMPVAVMILYANAWDDAMTNLGRRIGPLISRSLTAGVAVLAVVLVIVASGQPQARAFDLLSSTPQTPADAQSLLDREDEIRAGLLNAYLASFRYPSAVGELRHVGSMYQEAFKLSWNRTVIVQTLYETLYQPMLYMPVTPVSRDEITRFSPGRESVLRTEPVE